LLIGGDGDDRGASPALREDWVCRFLVGWPGRIADYELA